MQPFFLNKWFLDYCKFLTNFQISEKVDFDNFCQCSHLFYGRMDFRDSYSFISVFSEVISKIFIFWRHLCSSVLSRVWLFMTPWTVAHQAPLSTEFSRQKYWSGLPFHSLANLPDPGIEPTCPLSPALQVDSLPTELWGKPIYTCSFLTTPPFLVGNYKVLFYVLRPFLFGKEVHLCPFLDSTSKW